LAIRKEFKIGLLITASLAALLWGLNYLKGKDVFTSRNKYYALYDQVDGLVKSNPVFMNGFRIGIVNDITFSDDRSGRLLVTLLIDRDVFVPSNSVARIYSVDLIGTKALKIEPGLSTSPINEGDTLKAELEIGIAGQVAPIKDKTERLIESMDSLARSINRVLDQQARQQLSSGLEHLEHILQEADELISDPKSDLNRTLSNTEAMTAGLREGNDDLQKILHNLASVTDTLAASGIGATIENLDSTLTETRILLKMIREGEGSLGRIVNDDSLYNNLNSASRNLELLLNDMKQNPRRYLHFSVFSRKEKKKQ